MIYDTLIDCGNLERYLDDPGWVIVDCRYTLTDPAAGYAAWTRGHIPGARYAHMEDDLSSCITPVSGRHPLPDVAMFSSQLRAWGVNPESQVVVYDDSFGAMAGRLWWLLRWLGHDAVALLDGGLPVWQREKRRVTTEIPRVQPGAFVATRRDANLVETAEVQAGLASGTGVLLDVRAEERFSGERELLDSVAGHVPGAINIPYDENLDLDGTYLPEAELRAFYHERLGATPGSDVTVMCGSGVTACHTLIALERAGYAGARLYAGSWSEWIRDPSRPVACG